MSPIRLPAGRQVAGVREANNLFFQNYTIMKIADFHFP